MLFPVPTKHDILLPLVVKREEDLEFSSALIMPSSCNKEVELRGVPSKFDEQTCWKCASTSGASDSWVTQARISSCRELKQDEEMAWSLRTERRESSLDFLTAQMMSTFFGTQGLPSLIRRQMSLMIAKNGEMPMPPATRIRFSYLTATNRMISWSESNK